MVIASIEDPAVIQKILSHVDDNAATAAAGLLPQCRAIFVAKNWSVKLLYDEARKNQGN
jgi:hypothetical protein